MEFYIAALVLLIEHLSPASPASPNKAIYPSFSYCDPEIIDAIRNFSANDGPPKNVYQMMKQVKEYVASDTSYTFMNSGTKCMRMEVTDSGTNFTFIPRCGEAHKPLLYTVEDGPDNTLLGTPPDCVPDHKWKWYTVHSSKEIVVNYACSDIKGSYEPRLTVFWVNKKMFNDPATKQIQQRLLKFMKSLKFDIIYHYGPECAY